jgi:hypothetical protein
MDIMACYMLTHFGLKFFDMPLFAMCVIICIQTSNGDFSVQKILCYCALQ